LVSRPGGIVRVQGDPNSAIVPLQHVQQGPAILQAIEYVDSVRENRTGVTRYNQGLDANSLNKTATGVNQIMQAAQQRIEMIARTFAETGVRALMLIIHAQSLKHTRQAELIKLRNEWVPVDPRSWQTRRDMTVSVGIGTGNKDQMLQHLGMIWQMQMAGLQLGIAQPQNLYETATRLTQNAGFKLTDAFWTDPKKTPVQQPPSPEQIKAQADMQKTQFQAQQDAMKFQAEQAIEQQRMQQQAALDSNREEMQARQKALEAQMKAELERENAARAALMEEKRLEFDRWKESLHATIELKKLETTAQTAEMSANKAAETAAQPAADVAELRAVIDALKAENDAPSELIQGPDGRVEYVKKGERMRKVQRDPVSGRAVRLQ
jgi:hypothetical protein